MQGFDEDYKDAKRIAIIGGVLFILGKILPGWLVNLIGSFLSIFFLVMLVIGAIAMWRVNGFGVLWDMFSPFLHAASYFLKLIFYYGPVNIGCYAFTGNTCLVVPQPVF